MTGVQTCALPIHPVVEHGQDRSFQIGAQIVEQRIPFHIGIHVGGKYTHIRQTVGFHKKFLRSRQLQQGSERDGRVALFFYPLAFKEQGAAAVGIEIKFLLVDSHSVHFHKILIADVTDIKYQRKGGALVSAEIGRASCRERV